MANTKLDSVILEGAHGKFLLLSILDHNTRCFFVRGGEQFSMHKDVYEATKKEAKNGSLQVHGGGKFAFNQKGTKLLLHEFSGHYGRIKEPVVLIELLQKHYPKAVLVNELML